MNVQDPQQGGYLVARRFLGVAVLLCLGAAGCSNNGYDALAGTPSPSKTRLKRNVELTKVRQESIQSYIETVGYLDAEGQTDIAAGVPGIVDEVLFREGDWVIKDETILIKVDQRKYKAMLGQARANAEKAAANARRAKSAVGRAEASQKEAQETLSLRQTVYDNIVRAGRSAKVEERQEAAANVKVAKARIDLAKCDFEVAQAELKAALEDAEALQALREIAENNFERSQVRAPYTGQINQRKVTRGSYIEEKTVVATLADLSKLRLVGYVPEKHAPLARGMVQQENRTRAAFLVGNCLANPWTAAAALTLDDRGETPATFKLEFELRPFPRQTFTGRIFFLSTVASPDTHMFECKAEVPASGLKMGLRPGFTAKIRCPLPGNPVSVVIPEEAMRASERGFIVFRPKAVVTDEGKTEYAAEAITVEQGTRRPGTVEIIKGLRPGDWIVQKGAESLEENTPLAISEKQMQQLRTGP
jgi:RND family efflux transporter MFP subunit